MAEVGYLSIFKISLSVRTKNKDAWIFEKSSRHCRLLLSLPIGPQRYYQTYLVLCKYTARHFDVVEHQ